MTVKMLIAALCGVIAVAGVSAAIADDGDDRVGSFDPIDVRKDDSLSGTELVEDDPDDDSSGDGDKTRGDDGTADGHNHDGDGTGGDDGTGGGDNSEIAQPAPEPTPAPAPAPVYDDYSDDGGYAYSGSG